MSGHNKWSQIKEKKGKEDAKKSKAFSMFARQITMESKKAKGDKNAPGLRAVIERARAINMPNDAIDRAVTKGTGSDAGSMEEVLYEGYGPGGSAFLCEGITDNTNRTTQEVKHIFSKNSGNMGAQGSVMWAFQKTAEGYSPIAPMDLSESDLESARRLYEALEEQEDIKNIFTNANLD